MSAFGRHRAGFTLVEILVVAPVVILVVGGFIFATVAFTRESLISSSKSAITYELQTTFSRIRDDARRSAGFLAVNSFDITSPQGRDNGTADFSNASGGDNTLILRLFATTGQPQNIDSSIVVVKDMPHPCASSLSSGNAPLITNVVYFVQDNSLWRRVLMPANYASAGCSAPWQLPTCVNVGGFCKTDDELMLEGVSPDNFNIRYYSNAASDTAIGAATDPGQSESSRSGALASALAVEVEILVKRQMAGYDVEEGGTARFSRSYANITPESFE